ncbi:MAG: DUF432 domain-containing protein [Desulfobacterales bacterium]|nr:DUF432 domain-containing protein [Desulfobacterales bacterium]
MYQEYDVPFHTTGENICLSAQAEGDHWVYRRQCLDEKIEKILIANGGKIIVNPIEPLTTPKEITPYFLISFQRKLLLAPGASEKLFLKLPVETGVYLSSGGQFKLLDSFSLIKPKFTLYGTPSKGLICKCCKSDLYSAKPDADPLQESVMQLTLSNGTDGWVEVSQAVFNGYGMKIYYSDSLVGMQAVMKISGGNMAETDFTDAPLAPDMKKSLEAFKMTKIFLTATKFVMEMGL